MSLEGNLSDFSLADLFQLLGLGKRSGCLQINHAGRKGKIYFDNGAIVYAKNEDIKNENAVYSMFSWQKGEFEFLVGDEPPSKQINLDWQNLILEAARRVDEITEIKKSIEDYDAILELVNEEDSNIDKINLSNEDLKLLSLINGKRTVNEVIEKSGLDRIEASKMLVSYKKANLIDIKMSEEEKIQKRKEKIEKSGIKGTKKILNFFFKRKKKKYPVPHNAVGLVTESINMFLDYLELSDENIQISYSEIEDKIDELRAIFPDMEDVYFSKQSHRVNTDKIEWVEGLETESILEGMNEILDFIFETTRTNNSAETVKSIYNEMYSDIVRKAGEMDFSGEATLGLKYITKRK